MARPFLAQETSRYFGVGFLLILAGVSLIQGAGNALSVNGSQDFQWDAARLLLQGNNPYYFNLHGILAPTDLHMPDHLAANQFPSLLLLLWPYAILPWDIAKMAWLSSNLVFTLIILYALSYQRFSKYSTMSVLTITGLLIASLPWRNTIGNGQHTLFSLAFFLLSILLLERNRPYWAGIALIISAFKYTLIFPLAIYFLYRRAYKVLIIAVLMHILCHLSISIWLNENPLSLIWQPLLVSSQLTSSGYIDLFALAGNLGIPARYPGFIAVAMLVTVFIVSIRLPLLKIENISESEQEAMFICLLTFLTLLITYHRVYDFVILIIPLSLVVLGRIRQPQLVFLISAVVFLTWYGQRIVLVFEQLSILNNAYVWVIAILSYTTLVFCAVQIYHHQTRHHRRHK
jgi:hypothetical protein